MISTYRITIVPQMMADNFSMNIPMNDDNRTANLSVNSTNDDEHSIWDRPQAIVVPAVFAIIFIVGLIGNATLIFSVLRNKPMRTKANILIVNLAIGDFILILFSVPFSSVLFTFHEWYFGNAICKLNNFMQTLSLGVSIFTLAALSGDRFIAIVYPLASYSSQSLTRVIVASVVIWVISTGLALMDLVSAHVTPCLHCDQPIEICHLYPEDWGKWYAKFRVIFRFVVYFAVPLIVIVCLYVIIAIVLLRQASSLSSQTDANDSLPSSPSVFRRAPRLKQRSESVAMARQNESRKKVAKVVLSFVVIFIVCWLPRHIYAMCFQFQEGFKFNMGWLVFRVVEFCLMFIYSAINPLALYLLNAEFRRYFRHYLFGCCYKPWRLENTNNRRSYANSFMGRTTYSVLSTGANSIDTSSDAARHRGASRASVTTETTSDVIGLQTMTTTNKASPKDDNEKGAK